MVVDNNITIDHTIHTAGYMNLSGFLGIADYADAEVHHCGGNSVTLSAAMAGMPTADADGNYRMNNDALLMEGYLCHVCSQEHGDFNSDGFIGVADLLLPFSQFGRQC